MMTVKEVSNLTGVSIRTLQYYDKIGLLHPAHRTQAGYRLYDDAALERLQQILLVWQMHKKAAQPGGAAATRTNFHVILPTGNCARKYSLFAPVSRCVRFF